MVVQEQFRVINVDVIDLQAWRLRWIHRFLNEFRCLTHFNVVRNCVVARYFEHSFKVLIDRLQAYQAGVSLDLRLGFFLG